MTPEQATILHDFLDVAAKRYPLKALAEKVDKGESTLRNELVTQPGYKLGLVTAIKIMEETGDLGALDYIERHFDRVAVRVATLAPAREQDMVAHAGKISRECGDVLEQLGRALAEGQMTAEGWERLRKETLEALTALAGLWVKVR